MSASRIGRYEILRQLGRGAMGVVYLARDPQIDRVLALKTVRFDGPSTSFTVEEAKARFLKEARISGRLQHPNIVTVYDVGDDAGTLYLAMEYISGGSLQERLAEQTPFPVTERIRICAEVADALAHAHARGVIHRDVKPANILLTETSSAKVTDFGIGKLMGDTDLTSTGQMVGSPAYMSPEQIRGEKVDVRSDIFSLGVVLYQALTLRKPFPADTLTTLVYQILNEEPPDPARLREDVPAEVTPIIRACLAKKRDGRYDDAAQLAEDLRALIGIAPLSSTSALSESKVARARRQAAEAAAAAAEAGQGPGEQKTIAIQIDGMSWTGRQARAGRPAADDSGSAPVPPAAPTEASTSARRSTPAPVESSRPGGRPGPPPSEASGSARRPVVASGARPAPSSSGVPARLVPVLILAAVGFLVAVGFLGRWLIRSGFVSSGGAAVPTPALPTPAPTPPPTQAPVVAIPAGTPTPAAEPTAAPTPEATPQATPQATPRPTRPPRVHPTPTPRPVATAAPAPTKAAEPAGPRADLTVTVRRFVKLNVKPEQARVFLDGRFIGIADDWDDSGGGALLTFVLEGRHSLRIAAPGRRDLNVDVVAAGTATQDKAEIARSLEPGTPSGPTGPDGNLPRPEYRTVGPIRFAVEPESTVFLVDGKEMGLASKYAKEDLRLREPGVYQISLVAPGHVPRTFRVIVSLSTSEARAVVKEKLRRM